MYALKGSKTKGFVFFAYKESFFCEKVERIYNIKEKKEEISPWESFPKKRGELWLKN
jgi:hypothetical protein